MKRRFKHAICPSVNSIALPGSHPNMCNQRMTLLYDENLHNPPWPQLCANSLEFLSVASTLYNNNKQYIVYQKKPFTFELTKFKLANLLPVFIYSKAESQEIKFAFINS